MQFCLDTPKRGKVLEPEHYCEDLDKLKEFKFRIKGCCDSNHAKDAKTEYISDTEGAQDMLFAMRIIESVGLQVEKPMDLEQDNKGAIDLTNNWQAGGRTRHIETRHWFLRDLKEMEIIKPVWIPSGENSSDLFTKNLDGPLFDKHTAVYCGVDEYMTALN